MNLLETIIQYKKIEIVNSKKNISENELKQSECFESKCLSLVDCLNSKTTTGIIAEFKRKSPSKGFINEFANVLEVTKGYANAGAACLSILTDTFFFGGSTNDLIIARVNKIPILRKDFIIDSYQITEAKAMGADVILLIASCLSANEVNELAAYAISLGLEVLLELHNETELNHICNDTILVGINNRNLKDFSVDVNASLKMANLISNSKIKIAESGIDSTSMIKTFKQAGYKGFLIGEMFMKETSPAVAFNNFVKNI